MSKRKQKRKQRKSVEGRLRFLGNAGLRVGVSRAAMGPHSVAASAARPEKGFPRFGPR
jgi:hypothetical protein